MTHPKSRPSTPAPVATRRPPLRNRDRNAPSRRDPHTRLIAQLLDLAGPDSSVLATSSRPWASATFVGRRHAVRLRLTGADQDEAADHLAAALPEAEFFLSGHLVADAALDERTSRADEGSGRQTELLLSILTIEDW